MNFDWALTVITDRSFARGRSQLDIIRQAIEGGATAVQLRDKGATNREMVDLGRSLLAVTRPLNIPLIVNDRVDIALELGCEGAHVGQADMAAAEAKHLLVGRILGVSATNLDEALAAEAAGADYLGVGPIFPTGSKADATPPMGPRALSDVVSRVNIPVIAIGGISPQNAGDLIRAGAAGIAVISAIVGADDPASAARQLRDEIDRARLERTVK